MYAILRLLQPTVFAITFLLIVMHLEQGWCSRNVVVLYHDMSHQYLTTYSNKTITTMPNEEKLSPYQCFEMQSHMVGPELAVTIYNAAIGHYLCINRQGDLKLKPKKQFGKVCIFKEEFPQEGLGLLQFRAMCIGKNHTLALNKRGRPYRNRNTTKSNPNIKQQLSLFLKRDMKTCHLSKEGSTMFPPHKRVMHCNKKKP